jgi:hypothetical protein
VTTLFEKLGLKNHTAILVVDPPDSFEGTLQTFPRMRVYRRIGELKIVEFALVFVTCQLEVDRISRRLAAKTSADPVLWFVYPKGTSEKYACDFNRDSGWKVLRRLGFDRVRQVAIDEGWSALRFRRVGFIKRAPRKAKPPPKRRATLRAADQ